VNILAGRPRDTLGATESLCPVCLRRIPAEITTDGAAVFLEKNCARHGPFRVVIWRDHPQTYLDWVQDAGPQEPTAPSGPHRHAARGCPFDCGLCSAHQGETTSAVLMAVGRCSHDCPVCFTRSDGGGADPSAKELEDRLRFYRDTSGRPFPLQLCGGEPTDRHDLPKVVALAKRLGFEHVQINSNGVRIAEDPELARRLSDSGAAVVYLGFDGIEDSTYVYTCGRPMLDLKLRALERCADAGLAVVLVPVLVPGVNLRQLGSIMAVAKAWIPHVKGVFLQPLGYMGAYRGAPRLESRVTLPEVLRLLEECTEGEMNGADFMPPGSGHPLCGFNALYVLRSEGRLRAMTVHQRRETNVGAAQQARSVVSRGWRAGPGRTLTVGGMLFQDAWNVDLARIRRCGTHIITDGGLAPLCTKYLTAQDGTRLYEGIA
jgi:7,8-dihydro-6-hydroxymethylpterin dimethyltransferase